MDFRVYEALGEATIVAAAPYFASSVMVNYQAMGRILAHKFYIQMVTLGVPLTQYDVWVYASSAMFTSGTSDFWFLAVRDVFSYYGASTTNWNSATSTQRSAVRDNARRSIDPTYIDYSSTPGASGLSKQDLIDVFTPFFWDTVSNESRVNFTLSPIIHVSSGIDSNDFDY